MKVYIVLAKWGWDAIKAQVIGTDARIDLACGADMGSGFMPVFDSQEAAMKYYPECSILEVNLSGGENREEQIH